MINYNFDILCDDINNDLSAVSELLSNKNHENCVYDTNKKNYEDKRKFSRKRRSQFIQELDSKVRQSSVIVCTWIAKSIITLVFSTGIIAYISINIDNLNIIKIIWDKYLSGKFSGLHLTGAVLSRTHLLLTHNDGKATLVCFDKNIDNLTKCIADRNPQIQTVEFADGVKKGEHKMSYTEYESLNSNSMKLLVWSGIGIDPAPWSPAPDISANLHLYQIIGVQIILIAYHQLNNETLLAEFSKTDHNLVHIVDQITCQMSGVNLNWVRYQLPEVDDSIIRLSSHKTGETRVSLPAVARVVEQPSDTRLLIACIDGSVHVIHHVVGVTHSARAGFIPSSIHWFNNLIVCAEEGARVQCFDRVLTSLHNNAKCINLQHYFREKSHLSVISAKSVDTGAIMVTSVSGGPLALLKICHPRLPLAWIRNGKVNKAVDILKAMDWETEGDECLYVLQNISVEVFRRPLNPNTESCLEGALGSYFSPYTPHQVAEKYRSNVEDLARKFFHHLLRRSRFDKALSLGVELWAWDLFADVRQSALKKGRTKEVDEATDLAQQCNVGPTESECSDSCTCSSQSSYTDSDSENDRKPPPLPRVSLPLLPHNKTSIPHVNRSAMTPINHSSLMPVSINQSEPLSTYSIRPNLHQYLERDLSIWNSNANTRWRNYSQPSSSADRVVWRNTHLNNYVPHIDKYPTHIRKDRMSDMKNGEKNVKFSDTVTINVVSAELSSPSRELADSLPICAPHQYLSAFEPANSQPTGTDYVEV